MTDFRFTLSEISWGLRWHIETTTGNSGGLRQAKEIIDAIKAGTLWELLTHEEAFELLKNPPQLMGPWMMEKESSALGDDPGVWYRSNPDETTRVLVFPPSDYHKGYYWSVSSALYEAPDSGEEPTLEEAKARADEFFRNDGWILLGGE